MAHAGDVTLNSNTHPAHAPMAFKIITSSMQFSPARGDGVIEHDHSDDDDDCDAVKTLQ